MRKIYIVSLITGEWDGFGVKDLFAVEKEYQAKFYCSRANGLLKRYKKHYQDIFNRYHNSAMELTLYSHYSDRASFVSGEFMYNELTIRNINPNSHDRKSM